MGTSEENTLDVDLQLVRRSELLGARWLSPVSRLTLRHTTSSWVGSQEQSAESEHHFVAMKNALEDMVRPITQCLATEGKALFPWRHRYFSFIFANNNWPENWLFVPTVSAAWRLWTKSVVKLLQRIEVLQYANLFSFVSVLISYSNCVFKIILFFLLFLCL